MRIGTTATGLSFGAMFFIGVGITVLGAAARNIGLDAAQIGLLQTVQNLGFMASVILFGTLADSFSKPRLLVIASLVLAGGFFFLYRSPALAFNAALMFCIGVGIGGYEGTTDPLLLQLHGGRPGFIINLNHSFVTAGGIAITAYLLLLQFDWQRSMVQSAGAVAVIAVGFVLLPRDTGPSGAAGGLVAAPSLGERWRLLRREPTIFILLAAMTATMGFQIGTAGMLTTYLMEFRGFDQTNSKVALILFNVGVIAGRAVLGLLTPRRHIYPTLVVMLGLAAGVAALTYAVDLGRLTYLVVFVSGLTVSILLPMITTLAGLIYTTSAGTAMGVIKMGIPGGGILVPLCVSVVARLASASVARWVFPGVLAVACVMLVTGRRVVRQP